MLLSTSSLNVGRLSHTQSTQSGVWVVNSLDFHYHLLLDISFPKSFIMSPGRAMGGYSVCLFKHLIGWEGGGGGRGLASKYIKKKWSGLLHCKFKGDWLSRKVKEKERSGAWTSFYRTLLHLLLGQSMRSDDQESWENFERGSRTGETNRFSLLTCGYFCSVSSSVSGFTFSQLFALHLYNVVLRISWSTNSKIHYLTILFVFINFWPDSVLILYEDNI